MSLQRSVLFYTALAVCLLYAVDSTAQDRLNLRTDIYGSHVSLMPYPGYQNDLSVTFYLEYEDYKLVPFIRGLTTGYHYRLPGATGYADDRRNAAGIGVDYRLFDFLRLRAIVESVDNQLSGVTSTQESYGIIYNQYLEFAYFELNNYAESFYIPDISTGSADTFARVQALKSYYFIKNENSSHAVYPFAQVKAKYNDNANFGVSGQNASIGGGYKFYGVNDGPTQSFSVVLEGHSVLYQSENFNGDWFQVLAALQWIIN